MTPSVAAQIAELLNQQNQLTVAYTPEKILQYEARYIVRYGPGEHVLGTVEVKKVQWYQFEIDHLSVAPSSRGQGIGTGLIKEAEARALELGGRIAQCTIRVGNIQSESLFTRSGYIATATFLNAQNGNKVTVYQKVLIPKLQTSE